MNAINPWSEAIAFPLLSSLMLVPLLATIATVASRSTVMALRFAFAGAASNLILSAYLLSVFNGAATGIQLMEQFQFAGMSYSVGVDGSNILFVPLTAVLTFLILVYTLITRHVTNKSFITSLMAYETILIGAFTAMNIMQFWLWTLLEILPVLLLTINSGTGQNRGWVVSLFLQYWGSGLLMTLAGFLFLAFGLVGADHDLTFDWLTLQENNAYLHDETLIFILLFFGFAIRMPLFPFHGWLPLLAEHGTVASAAVFLVGLKLGLYALIRFILPLLPGVAEQWAGFVLTLGIISIFYGALLALAQINLRRLLAFAAVSHAGILVIGAFCFNAFGLEGSLLLSVGYGLASAGLLLSVGLVYQRTRTTFMPRLGGLFDNNATIALLFLIAAISVMAMPGTPSFDATHLLVEGVIEEHGWLVAIAMVLGNVLAAAVLLRAFQQSFIAHPKRLRHNARSSRYVVITERSLALIICLLLIGTGYYTTPWLGFIDQAAAAISKGFPIHASQLLDEADVVPLEEQ